MITAVISYIPAVAQFYLLYSVVDYGLKYTSYIYTGFSAVGYTKKIGSSIISYFSKKKVYEIKYKWILYVCEQYRIISFSYIHPRIFCYLTSPDDPVEASVSETLVILVFFSFFYNFGYIFILDYSVAKHEMFLTKGRF